MKPTTKAKNLQNFTELGELSVQSKARNASRHDELTRWVKQYELNKALDGSYPDMINGGYCLETGLHRHHQRLSIGHNVFMERWRWQIVVLYPASEVAIRPNTLHGLDKPHIFYTMDTVVISNLTG